LGSFADRGPVPVAAIREALFLESAVRDRTAGDLARPTSDRGGITVAGQRRDLTGFAAEQSSRR